jgi:hypothetical protein
MPGYSGTPLPKKLGLRPGFRVYLVNEPMEVHIELQAELAACDVTPAPNARLDFVMVFETSRTSLWSEFRKVLPWLAPAGMCWACWPKRSSGVATDLDEPGVRGIGLRTGLVDVKVCAVSETWSGLKFVRRLADREAARPPPDVLPRANGPGSRGG